MDKSRDITFCQVCKKNKMNCKIKKYGTHFFNTCPQCEKDMELTKRCMNLSAKWYVAKNPKKAELVDEDGILKVKPLVPTT